ncbi:MAG TPA: TetR family transcriptional regulator [Candidatus Binatus sp.]|nr:TetR family transcriptional regulator [Candidatus Binatus sp.]
MTPRRYAQSRRAHSAAATRQRIIEAAIEVYRDRGVTGASLQAVAVRADVSRGTIVHHFGGSDGLLVAVLEAALAAVDAPDERILNGASSLEERARRYAEAMLRFYDRTSDWWRVFAGERNELPPVPAIQSAEQRFWAAIGGLQAAALGAVARDREIQAVAALLVAPHTMGALTGAGLAADEAIDLASDLFVAAVLRAERRGAS